MYATRRWGLVWKSGEKVTRDGPTEKVQNQNYNGEFVLEDLQGGCWWDGGVWVVGDRVKDKQ